MGSTMLWILIFLLRPAVCLPESSQSRSMPFLWALQLHLMGEAGWSVPILPSELGLDVHLCEFQVPLLLCRPLPLGCSPYIPGL